MSTERFDIAIIGGGPGGYVAAIRAAQLGMRAALVEREHLGGVCLNWGCIPTKALLRSAEVYESIRHGEEHGVFAREVTFDLPRAVERSRRVAAQLNAGVKRLLARSGVEVREGRGRLVSPGVIRVEGGAGASSIAAEHVVLAAGARPRVAPPLAPDGDRVWGAREAMTPRALPGSLLVVGSGAIGIEFASFYRSLGVEVTLVEMLDRLLPLEDAEVSAFVRKAFEKRGVVVHTSAVVQELGKAGAGVVAGIRLENRTLELRAERVIAAVGIVGNVEDLGIEGTRVRVHGSHVVTDEWCQTDEPGVYAIGDVAGPPWLAHKASHEGILCVERIAGVPGVHPIDVTRVPSCTYGSPQVASVGLTEEDARGRGHSVKVGRFSFRGNGKAIALGAPDGFVKTVFDESTGELLGAHLVGPEVTELIQGFAIAKTLETTEAELVSAVFAHPTLSEALQESVLASLGRAIHA